MKTFSLISDTDKANLTKELQCLLPHPPVMCLIILWIKDFFFQLTSSSVIFHLYIAIYHAWMAIYIIVFV